MRTLGMTKRHFEAIAAGIKAEQSQYDEQSPERLAIRDVALQMCIVGHQFNAHFHQDRFLTACGF